jgi:hypothetical protein
MARLQTIIIKIIITTVMAMGTGTLSVAMEVTTVKIQSVPKP